jgi:predicted dehydrogenase
MESAVLIKRFLIVSLGSIGLRHLRNLRALRPDAHIAVLRQHTSVESGAVPAGADQQFTTLEQVLAYKPDAAIIAGPSTTHLDLAIHLAKAGVHLLIEKPLADKPEGLDVLIKLCKQHGLILMTGYNLRFLPSLREVHRLIKAGTIGRVLGARAEVGQYLPDWRPLSDYRQTVSAQRGLGGGVLLELSHEFDYIYWMFGSPARVTARGGHYSQLEVDVEDMVEITLEYQSPARLINIHLDFVQRAPMRRCRFIGDAGTLLWDGLTDRIECYKAETGKWEIFNEFACNDRNQMYLDELQQFFRCIELGETPLIDGVQGYAVLEIAHAAQSSISQSNSVEMKIYE